MQDKYLGFGALFGFLLSRAGATNYDAISGMFRLTDLHLLGVIGAAVAINAVVFRAIGRFHVRARNGEPITLSKKPLTRGLVVGALLFGAGWAIAGTCPGTALAQIGEGQLAGVVTLAGIVLGAWLGSESGAPLGSLACQKEPPRCSDPPSPRSTGAKPTQMRRCSMLPLRCRCGTSTPTPAPAMLAAMTSVGKWAPARTRS
jgi:uncharacterized protein